MLSVPDSPRSLGPWTLESLLGSGGGGAVWRARGPDGLVALKVAQLPEQRAALLREGQLLQALDHSGIVPCVGLDPEGAWMATPMIEGQNLRQWAQGRSLAPIVEQVSRLAEALAHLHEHSLVHGDIKPTNALVDESGHIVLIDLGVARHLDEPGVGMRGTPGYLAPEVLRGQAPDFASDLWSLGAVLYGLLAGNPPFGDRDPAALMFLPLTTLPEPLSSLRPHVPRQLDSLLMRLLARNPDSRPQPAARLPGLFRRALRSAVELPVVGMRREREALRGLVVATADGQPGAAIVHGPEGSGRRTLIEEAVEAARREGLVVVEAAANPRDTLAALREVGGPALTRIDGRGRDTMELCSRVLGDGLPALVLVRADGPMPTLGRLGAVHLSPQPLGPDDVLRLGAACGRPGVNAEELVSRTRGLPAALLALLNSSLERIPGLDEQERSLLSLAAERGMRVEELARRMGLGEHALLDVAEPLLERGLLVEEEEGERLRATLV